MDTTTNQSPTWLAILYILCLSLLGTALYEILWAWKFAGNCCAVSSAHDLPVSIILGLVLTSLYVIKRTSLRSGPATAGLLLLALVLLAEMPVKKYIGENMSSSWLSWYALFPLAYLMGVGLIASGLKKVVPVSTFLLWGVVLITEAAVFAAMHESVLGGWGIAFTVTLLVFQFWLLVRLTRIARMDKEEK